ncbi:MAG: PIN domain-containing protein [Lachnospiraceae bacterium]|nr:PIN domain-containing protein [Lachnospiraceae bacterium]
MVVLVDTNVIIDFLITREPFYRASAEVIEKCANKEITGYIAFHSIPNFWYILRKVPEDKRREWIMDVCSFLRVAGASHEEVVKAIRMKDFADFEDCLQDRCAVHVSAEYIITRNPMDFTHSKVQAVLPEDFLKIFSKTIS